MKVHEQSFSFFPSSVCVIGLRRTIWCESLNMIYLSLAKRSLLGCPDASIVLGRQWLNSRGLSLLVSCLQQEGLLSGCVVSALLQGLWGKYFHKFHHSFIPLLAPPEDSKYFNSKGGQCFCNADLRRGIWGQAGKAGWQWRVSIYTRAKLSGLVPALTLPPVRSWGGYLSSLYLSWLPWWLRG